MSDLYCAYFGLTESPFSLAPDPRFVLMSERHREALAHLMYGLGEGGGFVQLTGEVGTGKTTICRTMLRQLPDNVDAALIFNPRLTVVELLQTICQELHVASPDNRSSTKALVDVLYAHLLEANARGRRTVVIIDEAQNLGRDVLEQMRLLTNLETDDNKLLQVFLIGQPELRDLLAGESLRQLAQRITARYHLEPLTRTETERYISHRLSVAGGERRLFTRAATRRVHRLSGGVPRVINSLCDRALLGAYTLDRDCVDTGIVRRAHRELGGAGVLRRGSPLRYAALGAMIVALPVAAIVVGLRGPNPFLAQTAPSGIAGGTQEPAAGAAQGGKPDATALAAAPQKPRPVALERAGAGANDALAKRPRRAPGSASRIQASPAAASASSRAGDATPAPILSASATTTGADATLGDAIAAAGGDGADDAARRLLALWGVASDADGAELCETAEREGLRCLARTGSWRTLRDFDLPAVLSLRNARGGNDDALLVALSEEGATFALGDRERTFPLDEVDRYWTGSYVLLWRPPLDGVTVIRPGRTGLAARWLWEAMGRVDGEPFDARVADRVGESLVQRVRTFQRINGLAVDGIAGPETLLHLGAAQPGAERPSLTRRTPQPAMSGEPTLIGSES